MRCALVLLLSAIVWLPGCGDGANEYVDQVTDTTANDRAKEIKKRYEALKARSKKLSNDPDKLPKKIKIDQDLNVVYIELFAKSKVGLNTISKRVYDDHVKRLDKIENLIDDYDNPE